MKIRTLYCYLSIDINCCISKLRNVFEDEENPTDDFEFSKLFTGLREQHLDITVRCLMNVSEFCGFFF